MTDEEARELLRLLREYLTCYEESDTMRVCELVDDLEQTTKPEHELTTRIRPARPDDYDPPMQPEPGEEVIGDR